MEVSPHFVDQYVGRRMRLQRLNMKISQIQLGILLGISFQQVQKYEKGTNRISASRLYEIADVFGVPPSYFFEGYKKKSGIAESSNSVENIFDFSANQENLRLLKSFSKIEDKTIRKAILKIVDNISGD